MCSQEVPNSPNWVLISDPSYSFKIFVRLSSVKNASTANCATRKLIYEIKKTGKCNQNTVVKWSYSYDKFCFGTVDYKKNYLENIEFSIEKGEKDVVIQKVFNNVEHFKTETLTNEILQVNYSIDPPTNFTIKPPSGPIMQGDLIRLECVTGNNSNGVNWVWKKLEFGKEKKSGSGTVFNDEPITNTTYTLCSEIGGFLSKPQTITIKVIPRPEPPNKFTISGPKEITDIESTVLKVDNSNDERQLDKSKLKWTWYYNNNEKIKDGEELPLSNLKKSTVYKLQAEYYGKKSEFKSFNLSVKVLPEPPKDFTILLPQKVNDGDSVWLKINYKQINTEIKWIWKGPNILKNNVDSIKVAAKETVDYSVYANLNGKISATATKKLIVFQRSAAPKVEGTFEICNNEIGKRFLYSVVGGKLGSNSKNWVWYEMVNNSNHLLGTGKSLYIYPSKTTTFFVAPDNNISVSKEFTVKILPPIDIPTSILAVNEVCNGRDLELSYSGSKFDTSTHWIWYKNEYLNGTNNVPIGKREYLGESPKLSTKIYTDSKFTIDAIQGKCISYAVTSKIVKLTSTSLIPTYIDQSSIQSHSKYSDLTLKNGHLMPNSYWVWYDKESNGKILQQGTLETFRISNNSLKSIYVRAEGECDTSIFVKHDIIPLPPPNNYSFINIGSFTNSSVNFSSFQFSVGDKHFYMRLKANSKALSPLSDAEMSYGGVKLTSNENRITNYPSNSGSFYAYNGEVSMERMSATGGFFIGGKIFRLYLGGGYGKLNLSWGVNQYDINSKALIGKKWANVITQSYAGFEAEAGMFIKLLSHINLIVGANSIQGSSGQTPYNEMHFGIGYSWW